MDGSNSTADSGAAPPAPPSQPDFVYNAGQAQATVAFGAIVTAITTAAVVARLSTRYFVTKQVRVDDAWALGALLSAFCVNIMQSIFAIRYLPDMTSMISEGSDGPKIPYATGITYNVPMALLKLTFLFQYYHIFKHVRVMRIV